MKTACFSLGDIGGKPGVRNERQSDSEWQTPDLNLGACGANAIILYRASYWAASQSLASSLPKIQSHCPDNTFWPLGFEFLFSHNNLTIYW